MIIVGLTDFQEGGRLNTQQIGVCLVFVGELRPGVCRQGQVVGVVVERDVKSVHSYRCAARLLRHHDFKRTVHVPVVEHQESCLVFLDLHIQWDTHLHRQELHIPRCEGQRVRWVASPTLYSHCVDPAQRRKQA